MVLLLVTTSARSFMLVARSSSLLLQSEAYRCNALDEAGGAPAAFSPTARCKFKWRDTSFKGARSMVAQFMSLIVVAFALMAARRTSSWAPPSRS